MYFIYSDKNDMCCYYDHLDYMNKHIKVNSGLNDMSIMGSYMCFRKVYYGSIYNNYVRVVNIPNDTWLNDDNSNKLITCNSVILSDRYYLYDPMTIKKFKIKVDKKFVGCACEVGAVKFLEWWKNSNLPLEYDKHALKLASMYNQIEVLEWWLKSGLELKYDEDPLHLASIYNNINVLDWWKNSGLPLKYSLNAISNVSRNGRVSFASNEWWINSGLPLK